MTQQNKGVSKTFYHITKKRVPYLVIKWKRQKNLQFHRLVVESSSSSSSGSSKRKKEEKETQNTQKKKKQRMKTDKKNADYWPFLALFQGKELFFVLCGKKFLIRPLPFGLKSCMTQKNKGVSKTFYHITKNRVPYLEIKWKRQKNLQFHMFSSTSSSTRSSGSSKRKKRRKRYTKYTEEKEAEDENWQKNMRITGQL